MGISLRLEAALSFLGTLLLGILRVLFLYLVVVVGESLLVLIVTHFLILCNLMNNG
jgi:hypothetical protein